MPKEIILRLVVPTGDEVKEATDKLGKALGDELNKVVSELVQKAGELSDFIKIEIKSPEPAVETQPSEKPAEEKPKE